jgi:hypothetical protein
VVAGAPFLVAGLSSSGLPVAFMDGVGTSGGVLYVLFGGLLLYNLLAPQRVVLAATGLLGREGDVTRVALPPVLVSVAVLGGLGMLYQS